MVTTAHEAPIELFIRLPHLLPLVLNELKLPVSADAQVTFQSERCTEIKPQELTADSIAALSMNGQTQATVILEVQNDHPEKKPPAWARYVAGTWARHQAPVVLLIYCPKQTVAETCAKPIIMGPGSQITPYVISPATLPMLSELDEYRDRVDMAVVAALLHANGPKGAETLKTLCDLLATIERQQAERYAKCLLEILPDPAGIQLEDLMSAQTYQYQDGFARMEKRGEARGEAKIVLRVLAARGIAVPDDIRAKVLACTDTAQLEAWADRAVTITTAAQLLD